MTDKKSLRLDTVYAWPFIELPGFREHPEGGTYVIWNKKPPIPANRLGKDFSWLSESPEDSMVAVENAEWIANKSARWKELVPSHFRKLKEDAKSLGLEIPQEFLAFFANPELLSRLPSCTGVFFQIPARLLEIEDRPGDRLLCFANDYQGCLYWHLYLSQSGYCVVATQEFFGGIQEPNMTQEDLDSEMELERPTVEHCCVVEETFSAFVYRYWIENQIWFVESNGGELSAEQSEYANFYLNEPESHYFFSEEDDDEQFRHRDKDAPDCPHCGQKLRTKLAKQCMECGAAWHES